MYKWMKAYLNEFGTDFPFSEVADLNEYEICRIIQYCVEHHAVYDGGSEDDNEKFLRGDGTWANSLTQADLLDMIYPVGSIYMSVSATSPNTLFGGTWEQMPAGRVLLAQGSADWGTYNAGDTGGEATHTLTTNEMPSHNHSASTNSAGEHTHTYNWVLGGSSIQVPDGGGWYGTTTQTGSSGTHSHTVTVENTGSGNAHNNMQPYIAVYMWKRTA